MKQPSISDLMAHFDGARGLALYGMRAYEGAVPALSSALLEADEAAYAWALLESLLALQRYEEARGAVSAHLSGFEPVLVPAVDLFEGRPTDRADRALGLAATAQERQPIMGFWAGVLAAGLGDETAARAHLEHYTWNTPACDLRTWAHREACRRLGTPVEDDVTEDDAAGGDGEGAGEAVGPVSADDLERVFDAACRAALLDAEARARREGRVCAGTDDVVRALIEVDGVLQEFRWHRADVLSALAAVEWDEEAGARFSTAVWRGLSNARWLWRFLDSETESVSPADLLAGVVLTEGRACRVLGSRLIESTSVLNDLALRGFQGSVAQWRLFERLLVTSPDELVPRALALGAAFGKRQGIRDHARHVLWMAQRCPRAAGIWSGFCGLAWSEEVPETYLAVLEVWRGHVAAAPDDRVLLAHAGNFFTVSDKRLAQALLERGRDLFPRKAWWRTQLSHLHSLEMDDEPSEHAEDAVREMDTALSLLPFDGPVPEPATAPYLARLQAVSDAVRLAVRVGQWHRIEPLVDELSRLASGDDSGVAAHHVHISLGHLALHRGDTAGAVEELRRAAQTQGGFVLSSFGPNMGLAKALLERGETSAVLDYFAACGRFWETGGEELERWSRLVKEGKIPDFGASLHH